MLHSALSSFLIIAPNTALVHCYDIFSILHICLFINSGYFKLLIIIPLFFVLFHFIYYFFNFDFGCVLLSLLQSLCKLLLYQLLHSHRQSSNLSAFGILLTVLSKSPKNVSYTSSTFSSLGVCTLRNVIMLPTILILMEHFFIDFGLKCFFKNFSSAVISTCK